MPPTTPAAALLEQVRRDLAPVEQALSDHPFLTALAERRVSRTVLERFAGEQYSIISGDRRSFAFLAARYSEGPTGELFLQLAHGEGVALGHLTAFAGWLGLDQTRLQAYEPLPGAQAYTAYVAWLALNGGAADVALAFLANLPAWGANCARMAEALRTGYGADDTVVGFFDYFAQPAPGFAENALAVVDAGLAEGNSPERAARAARLLQAYELMFWDALAQAAAQAQAAPEQPTGASGTVG